MAKVNWRNRITGHGEEQLDAILFNPANWRIHPKAQQDALEGVLSQVGWVQDVIVNTTTGHLVDGHLRCQVAARNGEKTIPVVYVELTEAEEALILTTLDPLAAMAATDKQKLDDLMKAVNSDDGRVQKMLAEMAEREGLEYGKKPPEDPGPQIDRAEELRKKWGVELGQLWKLGEHRLICGDCRDLSVIAHVMNSDKAVLVFTDPPYNVAIVGGTHDPRDDKNFGKGPRIENDCMSDSEFDQFLLDAFTTMNSVMNPGASFYVCAPPGRTETQFRNAIDKVFTLRECIVWAKQQPVFGRQDYHWQHESILYGWKDGAAHYFCDDHTQTTLWSIDRPMRSEKEHPTQKPIELPEKAIQNSSRVGDIVLDSFCGTGTTLNACERLSRKCRAVEISPAYVAVAIERWAQMTGGTPELVNVAI